MKALPELGMTFARGENLGTYIAILAAAVFPVLTPLHLASDALAATLALLGVLCASLLASRHQNTEVARALAQIKHERPLAHRFLQPHCELADVTTTPLDLGRGVAVGYHAFDPHSGAYGRHQERTIQGFARESPDDRA